MPQVINREHIGPKFEYNIFKHFSVSKVFFTARIMRSNSSKVNKFNKQQVIHVTAAERMRGRDEVVHIARVGIIPNVAFAGLYVIPATSHQMLGLLDRQAYTNHLVSRNPKFTLTYEDADNSTELMPE